MIACCEIILTRLNILVHTVLIPQISFQGPVIVDFEHFVYLLKYWKA
jgi:hypothetical protein